MLVAVHGIYRQGKIELGSPPGNIADDTPVIITFLASNLIDLRAIGIGESQALDLRTRLAIFVEEWDSPEMSLYDNYDAAKAGL